jgi:phosphopantothenoylcysteine decarboxylase / phosphopantothenate---cysteine ligase
MNPVNFFGKKILITAGPTREAIDPVRYISNHSSGKMGYALAQRFLEMGAEVALVTGPVSINLLHPRLKTVKVNSANEMYLACCRFFEEVDIAVFAAAVADYRPERVSGKKIKKDEDVFMIKMIKNIDIALEFGKIKTTDQISVGFALETEDEFSNAIGKLERKKFDMVVLNSMNDNNATFGFDTNRISIIKRNHAVKNFPLKHKREVAEDIINEISSLSSATARNNAIMQFEPA